MRKTFTSLLCIAYYQVSAISGQTEAKPPGPAVLEIQADQVTATVSPRLYGLMTEEINYSYDGGIYGELIRNRVFKDDPVNPIGWSLVQEAGGTGTMSVDMTHPLNKTLIPSLKLEAKDHRRLGAANGGYWGIPVKPETTYRASFYAKVGEGFTGSLTVSIESNDGSKKYAQAEISGLTTLWERYSVNLVTEKVPPTVNARFVIYSEGTGPLWLDLVSLFPPTWKNRPNGNRGDLMQKLADMKPAFLRLPGGNYVEGDTLDSFFDWKNTIHDLTQRPGHQGTWKYRSSDGLGLLEFLEWCEDLSMEPVLAVYAGYSLKQQPVTPGPLLEPYVQDALDEIEYITGDAKTYWGRQRIKDGHPEPFSLTYVEVGNEDKFDHSKTYEGRFSQFFDAIKARYPQLQVIATTSVKNRTPDLVDEHYYRSVEGMWKAIHQFDKYDRHGPKIMVGEWATREGVPTPHHASALADAAWMTGMERNSDVIVMSCYAPLFVNVNPGGMQWKTDLIGYDGLTSYGSPSYYAQLMFSNHHGDTVVASSLDLTSPLAYSVTRDSGKGTIYIKAVNPSETPQEVSIHLKGASGLASKAKVITLRAEHLTDTNSIMEPEKIVPKTSSLGNIAENFPYSFPPYSITVLVLTKN